MRARLTERQNEAYEFIRAYLRDHRKPPTLEEIGQGLGIRSTNGVYKLLQTLEKKGHIRREPNAARGIQLTDAFEDPFGPDEGIPTLMLISRTASDRPERLRKRPSGFISVDPQLLRGIDDPDTCLIARAGDDGMGRLGILKGDYVVVEEVDWEDLQNGELAAFLVRDMLQVRSFHYVNERIHLRPADRTYTEEMYPTNDPGCYVVGRVVAVMRTFQRPG